MIAIEYISGKNWNGFTKGMFLLFIAFAVIDGPNLVQRINGLDAGLSDGMQKVMSAYYAGGVMAELQEVQDTLHQELQEVQASLVRQLEEL